MATLPNRWFVCVAAMLAGAPAQAQTVSVWLFTDSLAYLLNQIAVPAARHAAMANLFTRAGTGIGLSFIRNPMGASDLARFHYSYDGGQRWDGRANRVPSRPGRRGKRSAARTTSIWSSTGRPASATSTGSAFDRCLEVVSKQETGGQEKFLQKTRSPDLLVSCRKALVASGEGRATKCRG